MQVQNNNISSVHGARNPQTNAAAAPPHEQRRTEPKTDQVELSSTAQALRRAEALANASEEVREERVQALREAIQGGTYEVDAEAIAERLVDRL